MNPNNTTVLIILVFETVVVSEWISICIITDAQLDVVFGDFESKSNFVGLYNLLLRIDRRNNQQLYD